MASPIEIEKHRPYLVRYALANLRDSAAAEDAVQETLLAALQGAEKFAGQSALRTWLIGILKHKLVDYIRRSSREQTQKIDDDEYSLEDLESLFKTDGHYAVEPREWESPELSLDRKLFFEALEKCMAGLPKKTAQVFSMREVMGMDTDEICKELKITSTNCWVLLYRARMALRACLEQGWFGGVKS